MNISRAAPLTIAIIVVSASFTTATLAHYADYWQIAYAIGLVFAFFAGIVVEIAKEN